MSLYPASGGASFRSFEPFGPAPSGPVVIAAGDVLGDSRAELVAASASPAGTQVRVVDLQSGTTLATYAAFSAPSTSPEIALGDVDGDGHQDIVVMARRPGTPLRRTELRAPQVNVTVAALLGPGVPRPTCARRTRPRAA